MSIEVATIDKRDDQTTRQQDNKTTRQQWHRMGFRARKPCTGFLETRHHWVNAELAQAVCLYLSKVLASWGTCEIGTV